MLDFASVLSLNLAVFNTLPLPGLDGFQLLVLALEASLGRRLRDEVKSGLNFAALLVFIYAFSSALYSDLQGLGPVGKALAVPISAAGKLAAGGLPGLVFGALIAQLLLGLSSRGGDGSSKGAQSVEKQPGNAFLFPSDATDSR